MCDHSQEFAHTENREAPCYIPFGEGCQPLERFTMPRRIFTMGADQDVGIDRDQERSSIRSRSELRSSRSTPGCRGPSTVTQRSLYGFAGALSRRASRRTRSITWPGARPVCRASLSIAWMRSSSRVRVVVFMGKAYPISEISFNVHAGGS